MILRRLFFLFVVVFWVTMNTLLWRSEFHTEGQGALVPLDMVWEKILRSPDDSHIEIFRQRRKIGNLRWSANAGESAATGRLSTDDATESGMVRQLSGYTIDILDGTFDPGEGAKRIRFTFNSAFTTNHQWKSFSIRFFQRPRSLDVSSSEEQKSLTVRWEDAGEVLTRTVSFAAVRDPKRLVQELLGPIPAGLLGGVLLGGSDALSLTMTPMVRDVSLGLQWEARQDWLKIGHARLRCYKLQARLIENQHLVVYVSRLGEILRAELPYGIVLQNTRMLLL